MCNCALLAGPTVAATAYKLLQHAFHAGATGLHCTIYHFGAFSVNITCIPVVRIRTEDSLDCDT